MPWLHLSKQIEDMLKYISIELSCLANAFPAGLLKLKAWNHMRNLGIDLTPWF